ncbi:MAG: hypothetical protein ACI9KE_000659 [Polyangiales bacterium]|jgi:hypothetical protein
MSSKLPASPKSLVVRSSLGMFLFVGGLLGLVGFLYSMLDSHYRRERFSRLLSEPSLLSSVDASTWAL